MSTSAVAITPVTNITPNNRSSSVLENGHVLVRLLPINSSCNWVTPAKFKPELVPEELMSSNLRLTVEDYVAAMQNLVNDYRFKVYIVFYKRVMMIMITLAFIILMVLLFSGARGTPLIVGGIIWLIINGFGIFISLWLKFKMVRLLEHCLARVNEIFLKNNILFGVDDRGKLSCHKVNLVFVYFDCTYCIKYLNDMIVNDDQSGQESSTNPTNSFSWSQLRGDIEAADIIITGSNSGSHSTRYSQREKYGEKLLLRYSQRWVREHNRSRIGLNQPLYAGTPDVNFQPLSPRHCSTSRCPCQYIEEHLRLKPLCKFSFKELFS
ncbi:uncharacterized protein LOC141852375 isoform X2 [Brevipalpus obovatus]|uniref:uncharacterized protein LOC141852375 isoform X2 n=1 Tax=Brevipalpus obovatus TaxID=246614 RepID=UPI003D9F9AF3